MTKEERYDGLVERFLTYVSFDTQSDENQDTCPSTSKQIALATHLETELKNLGLTEVERDEHGYVYATLPATDASMPTIGFIAHMDTSPDASGKDIKPRIVRYTGEDIILNEKLDLQLSASDYPELIQYQGQDLIVTDGTTLLGADDKAGIAEIVTAAAYLQTHPEIKHGKVRIGFNPDEEIGMGAHLFDVQKFGADWAYTMDGGEIGELEYENFNAASAKITFIGRNIHPGSAKNKMINAMKMAMEFQSLLPQTESPEHTEGREGFYHLTGMEGEVEQATLHYIIRDHNADLFEQRKETIKRIVAFLCDKYGDKSIHLEIRDQYRNMIEQIMPVMHIVDRAKKAMAEAGITPKISPIRGGTDGAQLSFKGLPCPNIFAGGHNFHGRFEYVPVPSMHAAVSVILNIIAAQ